MSGVVYSGREADPHTIQLSVMDDGALVHFHEGCLQEPFSCCSLRLSLSSHCCDRAAAATSTYSALDSTYLLH